MSRRCDINSPQNQEHLQVSSSYCVFDCNTHKSLSYFMMLYDEFAAVKMIGFVDFNHFFSKHVNFDKACDELVSL